MRSKDDKSSLQGISYDGLSVSFEKYLNPSTEIDDIGTNNP